MDPYQSILITCTADTLLLLRENAGMTQEELAELLRISVRAYGDLERRCRAPGAGTLLRLLLQLEPAEVLEFLDRYRAMLQAQTSEEVHSLSVRTTTP